MPYPTCAPRGDSGGTPTTSAFYSLVGSASLVASSVSTFFDYALDVTDVVLAAETTYWISIYSNDSPSNYTWANSGDGSAAGVFNVNGGTWVNNGGNVRSNHVFSLQSSDVAAVPLPAAFPLLGAGLAGMMLVGSRRKRKAATAV